MKYIESKKDRIKLIKSVVQAIIIFTLIFFLFNAYFNFNKYEAYPIDSKEGDVDKGFISVSYFAVDREGDKNMISSKRLEEHLEALKINGYKTIDQEDIEDYYNKDKRLDDKSLFLIFEDGRRDTAIFSSPLLEKYNYLATILNYADKFERKDPKFLNSRDIKRLEKGSFWEVGSNGYRLSYINVFDRYDNYLGELNSDEFVYLRKYIARDYNHYLMDFIRDEHKIPKEDYEEMEKRIRKDYNLMEEAYIKAMGHMPKAHVLMHSNTGQFATNDRVSKINEELIKKNFIMNFNREGYSLNNRESSIYDLTRMQPQPYWYANHLLMRIKDDTGEDLIFIEGDSQIKEDWEEIEGVTEYRKSSLILTSEPRGRALIRLKKENKEKNFIFTASLRGNILGSQKVYLKADKKLEEYISLEIKNNILYIEEDGKEIYTLDLNEHDEIKFPSIEEDRLEALREEYKLYSKNSKKRINPTRMARQVQLDKGESKTSDDGDEKYIKELQINDPGIRELKIIFKANMLTLIIDDKEAVKNLSFSDKDSGHIFLESSWEEYGYSQRNLVDDVYDGVFDDILISDMDNEIIYINKLRGKELYKDKIGQRWNQIVNWFIRNL